jgi:hypothetical protein
VFIKNFLRYTVAFSVAASFYALAEPLKAKTGAWEFTMTLVTTGVPIPAEALAKMPPEQRSIIEKVMLEREGKPSSVLMKHCVTQNDLDQDRMLKQDLGGRCKKVFISKSAEKVIYDQSCAAPYSSISNVTIKVITPENILASIDEVKNGAGKTHLDIKGRWIGFSCLGIREGSRDQVQQIP